MGAGEAQFAAGGQLAVGHARSRHIINFPFLLTQRNTCNVQVEKTRHYLLLREKLEATLLAGQDALYKSSDISELAKSPVLSQSPSSSPAPDSPNQRQRELAAKVTGSLLRGTSEDASLPIAVLTPPPSAPPSPVSASADAHLQQGLQPGEQQCQ